MRSGKNPTTGQLLAFKTFRWLAFPILLFAVVLVGGWQIESLTAGLSMQPKSLHWMLLISALFTVGRSRFTQINYALCFLPVFLLLLIVFFAR